MDLFDFLRTAPQDLFAFNLLPPKSKAELEELALKKRNFVYAVMVPVACLVVAIILFAINSFGVIPTRDNWDNAVDTLAADLDNPNNEIGRLRVINGELIAKTEFITEPISQNVDFERVFSIAEQVFEAEQGLEITSYSREDDGTFTVRAATRDREGPVKVLDKLSTIEDVESAFFSSFNYNEEFDYYTFDISFKVEVIEGSNLS